MQVGAGRRARPILGPSDPRPVPQSATRPFLVLCPHLALSRPPMSPRQNREPEATAIHSQHTPGPTSSPQTIFSCSSGFPLAPRGSPQGTPTPTRRGLTAASTPQASVQADSPLHLFPESPDLIRFPGFLPVLGQSLHLHLLSESSLPTQGSN